MQPLTRWVLSHKRIVVVFWVIVTLVGVASAGSATKALKQKFSVPGKEGWVANQQIAREFHGTGGDHAPLLPVVTLPAGRSVDSAGVRGELRALEARFEQVLPGSRQAGYASTGSRAFVSADGRTTFIIAYPPPDPNQPFGDNPNAAKKARAALAGATIAGAPVHLTGFDALSVQNGGGNGPGVLLEAMLGGLGALVVLAFVFASFLAVVPIVVAIVSIVTSFLVVWGLTTFTEGEAAARTYILTASATGSLSGVTGSATQHIDTATCSSPGPTFAAPAIAVAHVAPVSGDPFYAANPQAFFNRDAVTLKTTVSTK